MITLCTVMPVGYEGYGDVLFDSIFKHAKHITDVLISVPTTEPSKKVEQTQWTKNNIRFTRFPTDTPSNEYGHSLGLHDCIDRTETDLIFFCDPDLFWHSAVDDFYLNLMEKEGLDYIGCSHHSAVANAYSYFPYLFSSLVSKKKLPGPDYLKGQLKFRHGCIMVGKVENGFVDDPKWNESADGKYLLSGPIPGLWDKLPNVKDNVFYDTSVWLCYWGILQKWKWLSFQTPDAHNYSTKYFRGQGITVKKLPMQKLIYHDARFFPERLREEYNKSLESEDE